MADNNTFDAVLGFQDYIPGHFIVPDGIIEISEYAFWGCQEMTSIDISQSVQKIGTHAFANCAGLKELELPLSIREIGCGAFSECWGLKSIVIRDGVEEINEELFEYCESLTSVTLPISIKIIKERAFWGCEKLKTITIPCSICELGSQLFGGTCSIEEIIVCNDHPELIKVHDHTFDYCFDNCKLVVPINAKEAYHNHPVFGKFKTIVGKEMAHCVKRIGYPY